MPGIPMACPSRFFFVCSSRQQEQKGETKVNSKKAKALVLGLILKREGIDVDQLKKTFEDHMTERQLLQSLKSLQEEGRIHQAMGPGSYVPTDLLDRIQKNVRQAVLESQAESKEEYGIPASLIEDLKERSNSEY